MTQDNPSQKECKVKEDQKSIGSKCLSIKRSPNSTLDIATTHTSAVENWLHFTFVRFVTCSGLVNTRHKKLYVHTCAALWFCIKFFLFAFSARLDNISLLFAFSHFSDCDISFNLNLYPRICHPHTIPSPLFAIFGF